MALLDSHVGEELWDAAKIFSAHLCITAELKLELNPCKESHSSALLNSSQASALEGVCCGTRLRGKRVLELGAGVASLGMCAAALGAEQVLCTDYDSDVLDNLEFNLKHNMDSIYPLDTSDRTETETKDQSYDERLQWAKLDWRMFAGSDLSSAEWLSNDNDQGEGTRSKIEQDFHADIVIGSALVYSAQGALYCADTIKHFLVDRHAEECWILQMPGRPGFDRFLLRLDHWGLTYNTFDISEDAFHTAAQSMGNMKSEIDDFKLYVIQKQ